MTGFLGKALLVACCMAGVVSVFAEESVEMENMQAVGVESVVMMPVWQKEAPRKRMEWEDAQGYCETLNEDMHRDWRLPTKSELARLYETSDERRENIYWSATEDSASDNAEAWAVGFGDGMGYWYCKTVKLDVLCVREKP